VGCAGPLGDLGLVGAGVDAQLRGAEVEGLVGLARVGADTEAGALGQQVGPARREVGQLGDGGVVLVGRQGGPAGVAAGGTGEAHEDSVVRVVDGVNGVSGVRGVLSHWIILEYVFDLCQVPGLACRGRNPAGWPH
jgi:hypothetical protein